MRHLWGLAQLFENTELMAKYKLIIGPKMHMIDDGGTKDRDVYKEVSWNSVEGEISQSCAEIREEHFDFCADTLKQEAQLLPGWPAVIPQS